MIITSFYCIPYGCIGKIAKDDDVKYIMRFYLALKT